MEKCLDSQIWHACAGGIVQMPTANSKVFYFPQGHAEHAHGNVDFGNSPTAIPPYILCRVAAVNFLAHPESDEVYAKIRLFPLRNNDGVNDGVVGNNISLVPKKLCSFAKTLTQSDANNGGGFSVPRYCAETIFPPLDYSADPPVQILIARDVHGDIWKFRHIYRGTPHRHLLTTGWSTFVNHKRLIAGDSIVFLRTETGDVVIGIRRKKRGMDGPASLSRWNSATRRWGSPYVSYSGFFGENDNNMLPRNAYGGSGRGPSGREKVTPESVIEAATLASSEHPFEASENERVTPESVIQAATLAASGHPFEVVYYPRTSAPEFCVKASLMRNAMGVRWCAGLKFKMAFETENSSRISWHTGTISAVQVVDPVRWPNSPWRLLQLTWDEPDLLQNVKCVNPWLVELVSDMPIFNPSTFSPRKKLRPPLAFPHDGQVPLPSCSSNPLRPRSPLCCISDNTPAGIQEARHTQIGTSLSNVHLNKPQSSLQSLDHAPSPSEVSDSLITNNVDSSDNMSCLQTVGNSSPKSKNTNEGKTPQFVLFGQPILTEQQMSPPNLPSDTASQVLTGNNEGFPNCKDHQMTDVGLETGDCKVFMESENVGRTLDLSVLGSYEELYGKVADMFGKEITQLSNHMIYEDVTGTVKRAGDEPFSEFKKTARRLTVVADLDSVKLEKKV